MRHGRYAVYIVCDKRHRTVQCPSVRLSVCRSVCMFCRLTATAAAVAGAGGFAAGVGRGPAADIRCCAICGPRKFWSDILVITARRCASAVLATGCLSVWVSVTSRCSTERDGQIELILASGLLSIYFFDTAKIQVPTKISAGLLPSVTLS